MENDILNRSPPYLYMQKGSDRVPYQPTHPFPYLTGSIDITENNTFKCLINPRDTIIGYKIEILQNSDNSIVCEIRGGIDENGNQYKTINNSILVTQSDGSHSFVDGARYSIDEIPEIDSKFPLFGGFTDDSWLQVEIPSDITTPAGTGTGMVNGKDYKWNVVLYDNSHSNIVTGKTNALGDWRPVSQIKLDAYNEILDAENGIKVSDIKRGMFIQLVDDEGNVLKTSDGSACGGEIQSVSYSENVATITLYNSFQIPTDLWVSPYIYNYQIYSNYSISFDYYFKARSTPKVSMEIPETITSSILSVPVSYSQSEGVGISYYQMDLYLNDKLVNSTGEVYSPYMSYEYDGLISGNDYRLVLSIVTDDGKELEPIEKTFSVNYEMFQTAVRPVIDVNNYDACIKIDFSSNTSIPGIEEGYDKISFQKYSNDSTTPDNTNAICIPYDSSVYWNNANGFPLNIDNESTILLHWHGHEGFSGTIFEKINEEDPQQNIVLSYSNGSFYYSKGNDIFTEKSFYPKTMSAINVETTEQDALYVINEEDILTDTDTLADSNLNYDYWYLIVILPTNLKIYQTKAYEETVVSQ